MLVNARGSGAIIEREAYAAGAPVTATHTDLDSEEGSEGGVEPEKRAWWTRKRSWIVTAVISAIVGAIVRGFLPPFVLDDPFWRDFLTGPPIAGLFALGGAGVAYLAARVGADISRRGDEREEWWARAEWALNLARSDRHVDRVIGLRALEALRAQATRTEYQMMLSVTEAVTGDVDTPLNTGDNGKQKRRWRRAKENQTSQRSS